MEEDSWVLVGGGVGVGGVRAWGAHGRRFRSGGSLKGWVDNTYWGGGEGKR